MTILQESGKWMSFVFCLLVVVDSTVSGFNYTEPTDVEELRLLGQVSATSCGSGSSCTSASDCMSGIISDPIYMNILENVKENCTVGTIPSGPPHNGISTKNYIRVTSENRAVCNDTKKTLSSGSTTYYGLSFWIYQSPSKWYLIYYNYQIMITFCPASVSPSVCKFSVFKLQDQIHPNLKKHSWEMFKFNVHVNERLYSFSRGNKLKLIKIHCHFKITNLFQKPFDLKSS